MGENQSETLLVLVGQGLGREAEGCAWRGLKVVRRTGAPSSAPAATAQVWSQCQKIPVRAPAFAGRVATPWTEQHGSHSRACRQEGRGSGMQRCARSAKLALRVRGHAREPAPLTSKAKLLDRKAAQSNGVSLGCRTCGSRSCSIPPSGPYRRATAKSAANKIAMAITLRTKRTTACLTMAEPAGQQTITPRARPRPKGNHKGPLNSTGYCSAGWQHTFALLVGKVRRRIEQLRRGCGLCSGAYLCWCCLHRFSLFCGFPVQIPQR